MIGVLDKLTVVDNNSATSVAELAEGMKRSANSAQQVGVSLEELISYIGTVSSVTRKSSESIGESLTK
jgi:TP901 family phage tail tape measure protein